MQRRQFLTRAAAATLLSASDTIHGQPQDGENGQPLPTDSASGAAARRIPRVTSPGTMRGEMLYRPLGTTGVEVSAIGFKTTAHFDTTARHPDWLGSNSPAVQHLAPQLPG